MVRWEPFDHEPLRAANRQVFGLDQLPAHDFGKREVHPVVRRRLPRHLALADREPARLRRVARVRRRRRGQVRLRRRRAWTSPASTPTSGSPIRARAPRAALALAMATRRRGRARRAGAALADGARRVTRRPTAAPGNRHSRRADRADRAGVRGGASRAWRWRAASARSTRARPSSARRSTCSTTSPATSARRSASAPTSRAGDGYARARRSSAAAMDGGQVGVLLVHDANPVYALPKAAGFAEQLKKVPFKVSTSLFLDETAALCDLLLPQHHALERWDDLAPRAGVRSLMQPVMEPVFNTRAAGRRPAQGVAEGRRRARPSSPRRRGRRTFESRWQALGGRARRRPTRTLLARGAAARRRVRRGAGAAASALARRGATDVAYTKPAFEGKGELRLPRLSARHAARRPRRQQAVAARERRSRHQDHLALVGRGRAPRRPRRLDVRDGEILRLTSPHGTIEAPGLRPSRPASRTSSPMPLGLGHTEYGAFAQGPRGQRARSPRRARGRLRALRVHPGRGREDRRLPEARERRRACRGSSAAASPRRCRSRPRRRGSRSRRPTSRRAHGEHEVNPEREVEALKGWSEAQHQMATSTATTPASSRSGAWRSTWRAAPAVRRASPPATRRTTSRPWASRRSSRAGR